MGSVLRRAEEFWVKEAAQCDGANAARDITKKGAAGEMGEMILKGCHESEWFSCG